MASYIPFNMSSFNPNDFSHLRDSSTKSFAMQLGKAKSMSRKDLDAAHGAGLGGGKVVVDRGEESGGRGKLAALTSEDWAKLAEDEGVPVEQLCRKEACREVMQRCFFNDQFKKMQSAQLSAELATAQLMLEQSTEDEMELVLRLADLQEEEESLGEAFAELQSKERVLDSSVSELKREKTSFSDRQILGESQLKSWTYNLIKAQQALAKAIWRKPGCNDYEGEDALSLRSSGGSSVITISKYDDARLARVSSPSRMLYNKLAGDGVLDYNEKLAARLEQLKSRAKGKGKGKGNRLESLSCSGGGTSRREASSIAGSLASMSQGAASSPALLGRFSSRGINTGASQILSPVKVCSPHFRVGVSSTSLSLEIGKSGRERRTGSCGGGGGGGASATGGLDVTTDDTASEIEDARSVSSALSALTSSTHAASLVSLAASSRGEGGGRGDGSIMRYGRNRPPPRVGVVRIKPMPVSSHRDQEEQDHDHDHGEWDA